MNGPEEDFLGWVLENNDPAFTICGTEGATSPVANPTDPEYSQLIHASCRGDLQDPTSHCGDRPAPIDKPEPAKKTDRVLVELEKMEGSTAHHPVAVDVNDVDSERN